MWQGATMIDQVTYDDGLTFPDPNGASMNLDIGHYNYLDNDNGANWCLGVTSYNGDLGTPGSANVSCLRR